eukprot:7221645-Heterocapsa_arctica.AAC.1
MQICLKDTSKHEQIRKITKRITKPTTTTSTTTTTTTPATATATTTTTTTTITIMPLLLYNLSAPQ